MSASKPGHSAELARVMVILRDILTYTVPAGNGGYVAEIGPLTYGRMVALVERHNDGSMSPGTED